MAGGGGISLIISVDVSKTLCTALIQTVCSLQNFNYMNIIVQLLLFELTKLRTWSLLSKELAVN
nr:MAG TPA: hypothetical protein [Caudoviricetes sp.]